MESMEEQETDRKKDSAPMLGFKVKAIIQTCKLPSRALTK